MQLLYKHKNITVIGLGHLLYAAFNWFFDHVLYVYAVYTWGMLVGGGTMAFFSMVQCALTLRLYEKMQIDWVGSGALHTWGVQQQGSLVGRLFNHIRRKQFAVFFFLCVFSDPFITTAYFRKGRFDGLTAADWRLFICSVLVSNGYWICFSALLGNGIAKLWQLLNTYAPLITFLNS